MMTGVRRDGDPTLVGDSRVILGAEKSLDAMVPAARTLNRHRWSGRVCLGARVNHG